MNRIISRGAKYLYTAAAIGLSVFALYTAAAGVMVDMVQRGVVLLLVFIMIFMKQLCREEHSAVTKILMLLLLIVSGGFLVYQVLNYKKIAVSMGAITDTELILCVVLVAALWLATKLTVGWPIIAISGLFVLYAYFGAYMPGMLSHRGYKISRIMSHLCSGTSGIFGTPLGTAATMVVMFIIFGSFLEASGGAAFFMDLAVAVTGRSRGGPAKAAVVSSALMGTISGNAASNVVTTGTFTIPLMKRIGYDSHVAGAIEAVASTGGQIMPPVMGAAAFIVAEMIGVPYGKIALAAVIPAALYYVSTFCMVHLEAVRKNVVCLDENEIPDLKKTWVQNWHTLLSIAVLIASMVMGFSAVRSALLGTVTAYACSFLRPHTHITWKKLKDALISSGEGVVTVVIACSCAGIIIGMVSLTGLGLKISSLIIAASGGHLLLALLLTFVTLFILGMGMPTAAAYIMVATLVAPGLQEMGLSAMAAHMFCLYGAVLSAITPPVALAAYAASGIAKANPMKIGFTACKFGIVAFIVPFFFSYQPALLWIGSLQEVLLTFATAVLGVAALAVGIQGYFRYTLRLYARVLSIGGAVLMIYPGSITDIIGVLLIAAALVPQLLGARNNKNDSKKEDEIK